MRSSRTSPTASFVICSFNCLIFLSRASCSSRCLSSSSALLASSSDSESDSDADDICDAAKSRLSRTFCKVAIEEDATFASLCLESHPSELSLARTASGLVSREDDESLALPVVVRPDSRLIKSGRSGLSSSSGDFKAAEGAATMAV